MKKYYLLALVLAPLAIAAQKKVDLDRFDIKVQYRSLPGIRLDSTYHTYNVSVNTTKMMQPILQEMDPANSVILEGWRKLPSNGHLNIDVKLEDLLPENIAVKERTVTTKDRFGVATGTKTMYYQEVVYTFAATAVIDDYKGAHIMDEELASRNYKQVYTSPEFSIKPLAEGYFLLNSLSITKDLYRSCVNRAMHYLSDRITDNFGFAEVTASDFMWVIGSRKHPEYEADRKAFQQMTDVLFSMNANNPIETAREKLKPVIDYFESIKNNYTTSSKHDRKIRYSSYFNLAVLYYYLDDPENMMKQANGLILNDYSTEVGHSFQASATRLKNQFQQTNIYTRHFPVDLAAFKGPNQKPEKIETVLNDY